MNNNLDKLQSVPLVSVLMPVYNGEAYLNEAIDSILFQTFADFEFIIINDGSTDKTEDIILSYHDQRIHYYKNDKNLGIVGTLNRGLDLCKGKYIARMDADDVSMPQRFEKQVAYMNAHPNVVACGCLYSIYGKENRGAVDVATDADDVRYDMALYCQVLHPMVLMRREIFGKYSLNYKREYESAEDYKLFTELLKYGDIVNIPQILGLYRMNPDSISHKRYNTQKKLSERIKKEYLTQYGINVQYTISEIVENDSGEIVYNTLLSYYPFVLKSSSKTWIKKNFITKLKRFVSNKNFCTKMKLIKEFNKVLSIKNIISIIITQ